MSVVSISRTEFSQQVLSSPLPVLVEFYNAHSTTFALDELAVRFEGRIKIVKIDIGQSPALGDEYEIRAVPALLLFKHGKVLARRIGGKLVSKALLEEWVIGALVQSLTTRRNPASRQLKQFRLENGLDVVVIPDHRAPMVTQAVLYKVGTSDEPRYYSGIVQLLMHLIFRRTHQDTTGAQWQTITQSGAITDAFFAQDMTVYWTTVARDHLETAMAMEAERGSRLRITDDDVETERQIIISSRRTRFENEPMALFEEKLYGALFKHITGGHISGVADEMAKLTRTDILEFFRSHYAPNNAVVVVAGDVTPEHVKALAERTYAPLCANPDISHRKRPAEPQHTAPRRIEESNSRLRCDVFRRVYAVPSPTTGRPGEAEALEVLARALGAYGSGRLYKELVVEDKLASSVSVSYRSNVRGTGALDFKVIGGNGRLDTIEDAVESVLDDVREGGLTQYELGAAKTALLASHLYDEGNRLQLAYRYGSAVANGRTIEDVENWSARLSAVTAADITSVAGANLIPRRSVTGWLTARGEGGDDTSWPGMARERSNVDPAPWTYKP